MDIYNQTLLKDLRKDTITSMEKNQLFHQKHFTISAINQAAPNFVLTLLIKSPTPQTITIKVTQARKALDEKFTKDGYVLTPLDDSGMKFKLDLTISYHIRAVAWGIEEEAIKADTNSKPETNAPIKTTRVATAAQIEEEIKGLLSLGTKLKKDPKDDEYGYIFLPRKQGSNLVTIQCNSMLNFSSALACIEPGYAGMMRIIDYSKWIFEVSGQMLVFSKKEAEMRDLCLTFLRDMNKATRAIIPIFNVANSHILAAYELLNTSIETVNWKISFKDKGDAISASRFFDQYNKKIAIDGPYMIMPTTLEDLKKNAESPMLFVTTTSYEHTQPKFADDPSEFNFLKFNRKVESRRVARLQALIKRWGFFGSILVIETDIIDGVMRKWIVDGQHRFTACMNLGIPIRYEVVRGIRTKYELVRLIAELNSAAKSWSVKEYMESWAAIGLVEYVTLQERFLSTNIPIMMLCQMYMGDLESRKSVQEKYRVGDLRFNDERAEMFITYVHLMQKYLPKNKDLNVGLYNYMRSLESYDNDQMMRGLEKLNRKLPFTKDDILESVVSKFASIYESGIAA